VEVVQLAVVRQKPHHLIRSTIPWSRQYGSMPPISVKYVTHAPVPVRWAQTAPDSPQSQSGATAGSPLPHPAHTSFSRSAYFFGTFVPAKKKIEQLGSLRSVQHFAR
jgi:hypothetical protein